MSKNLVIVESPAKAKTIQKYLGKDFEVKSSFGHIRDLPKKGMGIDLSTFTPDYEVSPDKKKLVAELKAAVKKADMVWLASDEDRDKNRLDILNSIKNDYINIANDICGNHSLQCLISLQIVMKKKK